jgi:replicative DNA helicase
MMKLGIIPPQDTKLEEAVLGAVMLEASALTEAAGEFRPEIFYKDSHRLICEAILSLYQEGSPIDLLTVTSQLRKMGKLEAAGGAFYVTELTDNVSSAANISTHIKVIQEKYLMREMIKLSGEIHKSAYDETSDVFDLIDTMQVKIINLVGGVISQRAITLKDSAIEVFREMASNMVKKNNNQITGIATPIDKLNQFTGGWQKGDLVIIAARPAMGKTGLALAFARAAARDDKAVLFFSLEMPHTKLTYRLIAQETRIKSVTEMQRGDLTQAELNSMSLKTNQLLKYKISIDDQAKLSLMALRSKANKMKAMGSLELIIVDYLQLMGDEAKGSNREQEISRISRGLKILAKDLNVPVIALSQLSRAVETRGGDKKPQLSDLRESGSIEQDADMVIFLYRPEYYGITEMDFDQMGSVDTKGLAVGNIAKHRNGPTGDFLMRFDAKHVDFTNWHDEVQPSERESFDWNEVDKKVF